MTQERKRVYLVNVAYYNQKGIESKIPVLTDDDLNILGVFKDAQGKRFENAQYEAKRYAEKNGWQFVFAGDPEQSTFLDTHNPQDLRIPLKEKGYITTW